jgi:hypothetical protein
MQNHEQKKEVKKGKKPRFYGQNKLLFQHRAFKPLGSFSHMAACRSSFRIYTKNELKNKTSPWAHVESELDMLGIPGKHVKYVVHLSKRKNWKK